MDLSQHLFIFRPECAFSQPSTQCSSGWIIYVLVLAASVLFFRNLVVPVVVWTAFVLAAITTAYGLPWNELTFHCIVGDLIGLAILYACEFRAPLFLTRGMYGNIVGTCGLFVVIFILLLLNGGVDVTMPETRSQYGLFVSFILSTVWAFLTSTIMFCILTMDKQPYRAKHHYVRLWTSFFTVIVLCFVVALFPHANSYIKSFLSLAVTIVVMMFYRHIICPPKLAIE
jgi:cobalamin synthase